MTRRLILIQEQREKREEGDLSLLDVTFFGCSKLFPGAFHNSGFSVYKRVVVFMQVMIFLSFLMFK